jgi:hypothetical protein
MAMILIDLFVLKGVLFWVRVAMARKKAMDERSESPDSR